MLDELALYISIHIKVDDLLTSTPNNHWAMGRFPILTDSLVYGCLWVVTINPAATSCRASLCVCLFQLKVWMEDSLSHMQEITRVHGRAILSIHNILMYGHDVSLAPDCGDVFQEAPPPR